MVKKNQRKSYTDAFRREAVGLADQPGQIYNWRTQFNKLSKAQLTKTDGTNYAKAETEEVRRLKKRIAELEQERDFLKKATAYFAKTDK